jgi:hypothetical protein
MQRVPGEQMLKLAGLTTVRIGTACAPGTLAYGVGADTAAVGMFSDGLGASACEGCAPP